ncbi:MAG: isochorismatase family protein [Planctomycetota bacterium]|jgi:nicotinamidase-related amidase
MTKDALSQIARYNVRKAKPTLDKTALLIIDMQKYFGSIAKPILEKVVSLIAVCRKRGIKVLYTRHGHRRKNDGSMLSKWWGELIMYGSEEWELIDGLDAAAEDIIDKNRYNAFHETNLDQRLQNAGIEDIIISGVMTNCCVETTARSAFDHDYGVFIVADACAAANDELHMATLKNLAYGFAYITDTERMLE